MCAISKLDKFAIPVLYQQIKEVGCGQVDHTIHVQSTLVISKLKGPCETLQNIRTSTYQVCRNEENINGTTKFHK